MKIQLVDKRREFAEWLQKIQHLGGGGPLLYFGVQKLREEGERPIAVPEIAIAAVVLAAFLKEFPEWRKHIAGHSHHSAVGWFDLAAATIRRRVGGSKANC